MQTKQQILKAIEQLPDDATVEDALDRLYLLYKFEEGIKQADYWQLITQARRANEWPVGSSKMDSPGSAQATQPRGNG